MQLGRKTKFRLRRSGVRLIFRKGNKNTVKNTTFALKSRNDMSSKSTSIRRTPEGAGKPGTERNGRGRMRRRTACRAGPGRRGVPVPARRSGRERRGLRRERRRGGRPSAQGTPPPAVRQPPGGCRRVGVRPPYRVVHHADRLSGADDRLRLVEDRGGAPAPPAGHVHRLAVARRTGAGRDRLAEEVRRRQQEGEDRLAEYPQRGVERECAERAPGRPRHERRGAERCRRRGRGAHARQPRSLRTGPGRGRAIREGRRGQEEDGTGPEGEGGASRSPSR